MVAGGRTGFTMRCASRQPASHVARRAGVISAAAASAAIPPRIAHTGAGADTAVRHTCAPTRTAPAPDAATCRSSSHSYGRVAPTTRTAQPSNNPTPRRPRPAAGSRPRDCARRMTHTRVNAARARPRRGCATTFGDVRQGGARRRREPHRIQDQQDAAGDQRVRQAQRQHRPRMPGLRVVRRSDLSRQEQSPVASIVAAGTRPAGLGRPDRTHA